MIIILLGAPGSGKGTQAKMIAKKYDIPHISTGDIFRYNIRENTPLGKQAKMYIDKGLLVPDEVTCDIVDDRIVQEDCKKGFILDGFPRTIFQAEKLDEMISNQDRDVSFVLNIAVKDDIVVKRLSGRRMCHCGQIYHVDRNPSKVDGICDECGKNTYTRDDDQPETIKKRLMAYHAETKPLEDFYSLKGKLVEINGDQSPDEVFVDVLKVI